jgi:O-antigen/teichoic acid export membrane protein
MLTILAIDILAALGIISPSFRSVGWVLLAVVPFLLFREYVRRLAFAHLKIAAATAMDIGISAVQLAAILLLGWRGCLSVAAVFAVLGGACGLVVVGCLFGRRQDMRIDRVRIIPDWRENWVFGRWALACQLTGLAFYVMPWMLAAVHGEAATGEFAACNTLVGLANLFVLGMGNYLTPKAAMSFSREGQPGLLRVLQKTVCSFTVVLGSFCVIIYFGGEWLAVRVMGPKYQGEGTLIAVLAVATFIDSLSVTAGYGLWAIDLPSANFLADLVALVVTLTTAAVLVSPWGPLGIAVALVAGRALGGAVRWLTLWKRLSPRESERRLAYGRQEEC